MSYVLKFEHLMVMYMYKFQIISWTLDLKDIIKFLLLFQNFTIKTLRYFFSWKIKNKILLFVFQQQFTDLRRRKGWSRETGRWCDNPNKWNMKIH